MARRIVHGVICCLLLLASIPLGVVPSIREGLGFPGIVGVIVGLLGLAAIAVYCFKEQVIKRVRPSWLLVIPYTNLFLAALSYWVSGNEFNTCLEALRSRDFQAGGIGYDNNHLTALTANLFLAMLGFAGVSLAISAPCREVAKCRFNRFFGLVTLFLFGLLFIAPVFRSGLLPDRELAYIYGVDVALLYLVGLIGPKLVESGPSIGIVLNLMLGLFAYCGLCIYSRKRNQELSTKDQDLRFLGAIVVFLGLVSTCGWFFAHSHKMLLLGLGKIDLLANSYNKWFIIERFHLRWMIPLVGAILATLIIMRVRKRFSEHIRLIVCLSLVLIFGIFGYLKTAGQLKDSFNGNVLSMCSETNYFLELVLLEDPTPVEVESSVLIHDPHEIDLSLPVSSALDPVVDAVLIIANKTDVYVQAKWAGKLEEGYSSGNESANEDPLMISTVYKVLQDEFDTLVKIGKRSNSPFKGEVIIAADRVIPYITIRKLIHSAEAAGFGRFRFLATSDYGGLFMKICDHRALVPCECPRQVTPKFSYIDEPPGNSSINGIQFEERVRGDAQSDDSLPLVVVLHGQGDRPDPAQYEDFGRPVRVVWPRGIHSRGEGFEWFGFEGLEVKPFRLGTSIRAVSDRLADFIKEYRKMRNTNGKAIVVGFSQGGMLAYQLALDHPELIHAIHVMSTGFPDHLLPKSAKKHEGPLPRVHALHGERDEVISVEAGKALADQMKQSGYDVNLKLFPYAGHEITEEMHPFLSNDLVHEVNALVAETNSKLNPQQKRFDPFTP